MEKYLTAAGTQEKQFDALYRECAAFFGLPDCAMWILYYLSVTDEELSQQDLINKMLFPKQTINSAAVKLAAQGLLEISAIPSTRNKKKLTLTEKGKALSEKTVCRMRLAEIHAVESMGTDKMEQFLALYHEYFDCFDIAMKKEGLFCNDNRK